MSPPEIQDSGHGASISSGQWGSGTGHRAGWQHGTADAGVVCVCVPVSGPWAAVRLSPSAQWANKGVPQELLVALRHLAPLDRRQCGVSRYCSAVHALNIEVAERSSFDLVNEFGRDLSTREIPQFDVVPDWRPSRERLEP